LAFVSAPTLLNTPYLCLTPPSHPPGAKGLNIETAPTRSWRATPAEEKPRAAAPAPSSYTPPTPAPASGDRWSKPAAPAAPQRSAGGAAGGASRSLSAGDLAKFKIADLAEIGRKRGVSGGRDATRQSLTDALLKAGVSTSGEFLFCLGFWGGGGV
jgi:hypothetical protein